MITLDELERLEKALLSAQETYFPGYDELEEAVNEARSSLLHAYQGALPELSKVVRALAKDEPIAYDKGDRPYCVLCGNEGPFMGDVVHAPDCGHVLARKLAGCAL